MAGALAVAHLTRGAGMRCVAIAEAERTVRAEIEAAEPRRAVSGGNVGRPVPAVLKAHAEAALVSARRATARSARAGVVCRAGATDRVRCRIGGLEAAVAADGRVRGRLIRRTRVRRAGVVRRVRVDDVRARCVLRDVAHGDVLACVGVVRAAVARYERREEDGCDRKRVAQ